MFLILAYHRIHFGTTLSFDRYSVDRISICDLSFGVYSSHASSSFHHWLFLFCFSYWFIFSLTSTRLISRDLRSLLLQMKIFMDDRAGTESTAFCFWLQAYC